MENFYLFIYIAIGISILTKYFIKRTEDIQSLKVKRLKGGRFQDFFKTPDNYISDYAVFYLLITCFLLIIFRNNG